MASRRFEILELLGIGALGSTYRATMFEGRSFRRTVALKVLHRSVSGYQIEAENLEDRAIALAALRLPALVHPEELVYLGVRAGIVSDWIDAPDLLRLITVWGGVPPRAALEIIAELARVLDATHGLEPARLHLNLRPTDILLSAEGQVHLLDFGLHQRTLGLHGRQHPVPASPAYMAPERFAGQDSPAGDIYALGATLFELLTGQPLRRSSAQESRHYDHIGEAVELLLEGVDPADSILPLLGQMMEFQPSARPLASYVATHADRIAEQLSGPGLREWAGSSVPTVSGGAHHPEGVAQGRRLDSDDLTGSIIQEGRPMSAESAAPASLEPPANHPRFSQPGTPLPPPSARRLQSPENGADPPEEVEDPAPVAVYAVGGLLLFLAATAVIASLASALL